MTFSRISLFVLALVAFAAAAASPSRAALELQNHDSVGGVASTPWLTQGDRLTVSTLTNATTEWIVVHVTVFDESWNIIDFDCQLSPMETTYFLFETSTIGGAKVTSECSSEATFNLNIVQTRFAQGAQNGFVLFHATSGQGGTAASLISDFSVLDFDQGYAFSANGWHFQRQFDTQNLTLPTPGTLATSFIAPDDDITADLILYNTNGIAGGPAPARIGGVVYDDDETPLSSFLNYDCFAIVSLEDIFGLNIDRRNGPGGFPYFVGHVTLVAQFVTGPFPGALGQFQRVGSVGYLVQTIADLGDLNDNFPLGSQNTLGLSMAGNAAWARKLLRTSDTVDSFALIDPLAPAPF